MLALPLLLPQASPSLDTLDKLLKSRDVPTLSKLVTGDPTFLQVIKTNGAYDTGSMGWKALDLKGIDGTDYVIFTTPMTSEDIGEMLFQRNGAKLTYVPETNSMGIKLIRHHFDLRFEVDQKKAILVDDLDLASTVNTRAPFIFRMSPQYKVSSITSAGKPVAFAQAGGVVNLARPAGKATYQIKYAAIVNLPNYAGSISTKEATLTNDYWYPMVARQPTPYDISVTPPTGWTAVCQGVPVASNDPGVVKYRMDLPIVYYSVSSAPYRKVETQIKGKAYKTWSMRLTKEQSEIQNVVNQDVVDYYGKVFGPWPFNTWGSLDSEVYGGGALEAYSFATYGGGLPSIDAHEPAHTFWGGVLNNTYLRSFWNESFAVFSDGLYHRNGPIGNMDEKRMAFVEDSSPDPDYRKVPVATGGAFAGPVASSLGYGKGAKVLQMLEQVIGTPKMIETMHNWVKADAGKDVSWEDYERVANRTVSGIDLKPFFNDWLRKPGYANVKITKPVFSRNMLSFHVGFEGQSFVMPLEVMLQYPNGRRIFQNIIVTKPGTLAVATATKPSIVSFDPFFKALRVREDSEEVDSVASVTRSLSRYTDPKHSDYLKGLSRDKITELPKSLRDTFIVGHPDTVPAMRDLCKLAGFSVKGDKLTWRGTTIDLNHGAALALVDLPGGGHAMIGLGTTRIRPRTGNARLALVDDYGRFLRGVTDPKTKGNLTFRL